MGMGEKKTKFKQTGPTDTSCFFSSFEYSGSSIHSDFIQQESMSDNHTFWTALTKAGTSKTHTLDALKKKKRKDMANLGIKHS